MQSVPAASVPAESIPVNDETQEQPELQPIQVEGHLNIISVQLVPAASVVAEPVARIQSGQANHYLDTISVQSVSANDETQEQPELQLVQAEGYPDTISVQSVPVATVLPEPVPNNDGAQVQLEIQPGQAEGHIDTISMPSFPATICREADSSFIFSVELQAVLNANLCCSYLHRQLKLCMLFIDVPRL